MPGLVPETFTAEYRLILEVCLAHVHAHKCGPSFVCVCRRPPFAANDGL